MHLNTSELLKKYILKVLFVMPKFNPIFTFSKIYLKLTKKSSYFCIFKLFHKKYLNFIMLAPKFRFIYELDIILICLMELSIEIFYVLCVCVNTMICKKDYYMHRTTTRLLLVDVF